MYVIRNISDKSLAWNADFHEWATMYDATIFTSDDEANDAAELEENISAYVIARIA